MTTSNRGKTNANQQIVNVHLNGLDLEKVIAKPKEKSKKKRRGGLAAELKRAAKQHQMAKDNAEKTRRAGASAFGCTTRALARRNDHPADTSIVKSPGQQCNSYSSIVSNAVQTCR